MISWRVRAESLSAGIFARVLAASLLMQRGDAIEKK
jgi:hypothetical protein